jgi:CubicO group peptidase (beta-lactamase class C family)
VTLTDRAAAGWSADGRLRPDPEFLFHTLGRLARRYQVPGAQLAVHHQGETTGIEVGELEHRSGCAVTRDAAFPIGSVSKSFTATLAMVLVADGDLELDEPVAEHLPELAGWGDELTLRRVLSHTSGLASGPDLEEAAGKSLPRYLLDHCGPRDLVLPPGADFSYSNLGYVIAGRLIEEITGMDWAQAVASILLQPLGIAPAFVDAARSVSPGRPVATGHSVNMAIGRIRSARQSLPPAEAPAAGLAARGWYLGARGGLPAGAGGPDVLPPSVAEQMRRPVPGARPFGLADGWGLGLAVFRPGCTEWVGHDGNADGTSCYFRADPSGTWIVALTSNANTGIGLWRDLLAELAPTDIPIECPRDSAPPGPPVTPWRSVVGSYLNGSVDYLVTRDENGCLWLAIDGAEAVPLTCYDGLVFAAPDPITGRPVVSGRFITRSGTGRVDGIQVNGRVARRAGQPARVVA